MAGSTKPAWERFGDAMLDWGGYLLLGVATFVAVSSAQRDATWNVTTLAIVAATAGWLFVMYSRRPLPNAEHKLRLGIFFVGLLTLAAVLMLRHPLFFIFMIGGFFYATTLRPLPLMVVGIAATSILINTLVSGLPQNPAAWTWYLSIVVIQTLVISAGSVTGEKMTEQSQERLEALARLEAALEENAGLHAQLVAQAREAGVLDERQRMAREIHDTIAQGLTGIITQLEAAAHAGERPEDRERHVANAERLARESLAEARRSVEASVPTALASATLPSALRRVAREWSELAGTQVDVRITGDPIALHPDIEVALLRTAQEALANVGKHAAATHVALTLSFMGDVVALDVRDDGVGFDVPSPNAPRPQGGGFGLTGMRQRIARVAGSLAVESEPGSGTAVSVRVPAIAPGSSSGAAT